MAHPSDLKNELAYYHVKNAAAITSSSNSSGFSVDNGCQEVVFVFNIGAVSGTSPTLDIQIQSSLNDNTATTQEAADAYANISGATLALTDSNASSTATLSVKTRGEKWLRVNYTAGGTSPSFTMSMNAISHKLRLS